MGEREEEGRREGGRKEEGGRREEGRKWEGVGRNAVAVAFVV